MQQKIVIPKDILHLAELLDNKFKGPFGIRFGLDALIGLIPFLGDLFTNLISVYIVLRCALLGLPKSIILKMLLNILIEYIVGLIPFLGNLFDFVWQANIKNVNLIKAYNQDHIRTTKKTKFSLATFLLFISLGIFTLLFVPLLLFFLVISSLEIN